MMTAAEGVWLFGCVNADLQGKSRQSATQHTHTEPAAAEDSHAQQMHSFMHRTGMNVCTCSHWMILSCFASHLCAVFRTVNACTHCTHTHTHTHLLCPFFHTMPLRNVLLLLRVWTFFVSVKKEDTQMTCNVSECV